MQTYHKDQAMHRGSAIRVSQAQAVFILGTSLFHDGIERLDDPVEQVCRLTFVRDVGVISTHLGVGVRVQTYKLVWGSGF